MLYKANLVARISVFLVNYTTGVPLTGVLYNNVSVTIYNLTSGTGPTNVTMSAGMWTELTTGAFNGQGCYVLAIPDTAIPTEGTYQVAVSHANGETFFTIFDVVGATHGEIAVAAGDATAAKTAAEAAESAASDALVAATAASGYAQTAAQNATDGAASALLAKKMLVNKATELNNEYIVYDDDGVTPLKKFDTKDSAGNLVSTGIAQRIPKP